MLLLPTGPRADKCIRRGPKPYKFIGFGDLHGPKPYKFIGFGDLHGPKPYKSIGFGDLHGPIPYKFIPKALYIPTIA